MWIIFCIFDITHHRRKLKSDDKKSNDIDGRHSDRHLIKFNERLLSSNDHTANPASTPHFNLQLFDDSDEFHSDDHDGDEKKKRKNNGQRQRSSRRLMDNDDDDDDDKREEEESLHLTRSKSLSLDNLSFKSSTLTKRQIYSPRDEIRRPAMDPGAVHHLQNYVQHRKESIVQRVIGYNYDDHSTAGGLYIRVGIGSKNEKNFIRILFFDSSLLSWNSDSFRFIDIK